MVDDAMFSSDSCEWGTPWDLVEGLAKYFGPFRLDPGATAENAKAQRFYNLSQNGLSLPWEETWFCNPPWRRGNKKTGVTPIPIQPWIDKAIAAGREVPGILFVASRTDTKRFRQLYAAAQFTLFVEGRITYERPGQDSVGAPFPSVAFAFQPGLTTRATGIINTKGEIIA